MFLHIMAPPRCQVTAVQTFLIITPEIAFEMPSGIMALTFILSSLHLKSDTEKTGH